MNLPAIKKHDDMLLSIFEHFRDTQFWYAGSGIIVADADDCDAYPFSTTGGRPCIKQEENCWLTCPKVPSNGLSKDSRKRLQQCKDCTNQILKSKANKYQFACRNGDPPCLLGDLAQHIVFWVH